MLITHMKKWSSKMNSEIDMPFLYWGNKQCTQLSSNKISKKLAKKLAKRAFKLLKTKDDKWRDCQILPWWHLFDSRDEALRWR